MRALSAPTWKETRRHCTMSQLGLTFRARTAALKRTLSPSREALAGRKKLRKGAGPLFNNPLGPMKAILLEKPLHFTHTDIAEPASPGPDEALVRVHRIGICGTDISGYLGKMP